ncbi:uncharacterized protein LOC115598965 [Calypte anna]|uniref:uncharacterized protein LOC115598965 n=1 Tax=Calypte anna TaxID=9244 RepID=UPI0011C431AE|nr:uncharacterized protein LOC115598965 [Calypte anna]
MAPGLPRAAGAVWCSVTAVTEDLQHLSCNWTSQGQQLLLCYRTEQLPHTTHLTGISEWKPRTLQASQSQCSKAQYLVPWLKVPFPGSAPGANRTPCRILSSADTLDAQEQRIYQLQTKQRERQAELKQKCSWIQQLNQDLEASDWLQEEAQKQSPRSALLLSVRHHSTLTAPRDPQLGGFRTKTEALHLINARLPSSTVTPVGRAQEPAPRRSKTLCQVGQNWEYMEPPHTEHPHPESTATLSPLLQGFLLRCHHHVPPQATRATGLLVAHLSTG